MSPSAPGGGTPELTAPTFFIAPAALTADCVRFNLSASSGEPTGPAIPGRRLRVLRGSAGDPLNLLQVMLAKGATEVAAPNLQRHSLGPKLTKTVLMR